MLNQNKNRKRVLIASDFYTPHWTGIVKSIVNMVESLGDEFEFTVITVKHQADLAKEEQIAKAKVIRENYIAKLSRCYYSVMTVYRFVVEVPHHDVVFISSPCSNILPFSILAKVFRKRLVIFHQGDLTLAVGFINKIVELIFFGSSVIGMKLADVVSTYARDYAEQSPLLSRFMPKFRQLLMPIYLAEKDSAKPSVIQPISDLKQTGKIIFGFGGRFVHEKGFDVLLAAIPLILEKVPNAHFAFAGETQMSYEQTYEKLAPEIKKNSQHISILGLLSGSALRWFYDSIDFILIPSRSDCCPLVQMEACLNGRPSICSDIPGASLIVKASGYGRIFESENPKDLAEKLEDAVRFRSQIEGNYNKLQALLNLERLKSEIRIALLGSQTL